MNTAGKTEKINVGPASGCIPNENTPGNIARPANITTAIFIKMMEIAELGKFCVLGR